MARGGDDGTAVSEQRSGTEDGTEDSFDPGLETGYLRSAPRDHELDTDVGAAPFDPGSGAGYDGKRAKRAEKRREKAEKKLQEQRERAEQERQDRERDEAIKAMRERERKETERAERERARLARAHELHEEALRAQEEKLQRRRDDRAKLQAERRRAAEEQREREKAEREQREQERKEKARALKVQERERHAERERQERAETLRLKREKSLKEERERAERMHARRKQMVQAAAETPDGLKAIPAAADGPKPEVVAAPATAKADPATVKPVPKQSLKRPTLKAGFALAAITAAAFGAGTLLGLPLPSFESDTGGSTASSAAGDLLALDSGTPASLTKGPFLPVAATVDYGEKDARFGASRSDHTHEGQDMFAKRGTPLVAARDGIVVDRGKVNSMYSGGRGNYVAIYSPLDDRSFVYLHMLEPSPVFLGDQVKAGQQIGQMGCTGTCFGTHLHFEVRVGEARLRAETKALDPLPYLRQWSQAPAPEAPPKTPAP